VNGHRHLVANGEISLLNNKVNGTILADYIRHFHAPINLSTELERDLELEHRKVAGLQDSLKDREREYQKLKVPRPPARLGDMTTKSSSDTI